MLKVRDWAKKKGLTEESSPVSLPVEISAATLSLLQEALAESVQWTGRLSESSRTSSAILTGHITRLSSGEFLLSINDITLAPSLRLPIVLD